MSTVPSPPVAHVSWLKKFGQAVAKGIGIIAKDVLPAEKVIAPLAAALAPQFALEIGYASGLFEKIAGLASTTEAAFESVGQGSNGPAKLDAVLSVISSDLDQWVTSNLPGTEAILKGEAYLASKSDFVSAVVKFLNSIDGSGLMITPSPQAVIAVAATKAALTAAKK